MIVRAFDPQKDDAAMLGRLNTFGPALQALLGRAYTARLVVPQNLLVCEHENQLVGCVHLFDAGFPFAIVDAIYLDPKHRGLGHAQALSRAIDQALRQRGVLFYLVFAGDRLQRVLHRLGFRRLSPSLYTMLARTL